MPLISHVDEHGAVHYVQDPLDPDKPVLAVGPITGAIILEDGTSYNVTDPYVELASADHLPEMHHKIGLHYEANGHPNHLSRFDEDYDPFRDEFHHICQPDVCGKHARTVKQHHEDFEARLRKLGHARRVGSERHTEVLKQITAAHAHLAKKES